MLSRRCRKAHVFFLLITFLLSEELLFPNALPLLNNMTFFFKCYRDNQSVLGTLNLSLHETFWSSLKPQLGLLPSFPPRQNCSRSTV